MPCSRAGDHGLAPALFHADVLRSPATLPALDRELLLSDAFLSYADALARGVMPAERRKDDQVLAPEPIDVAAVLDAAIASPDPAAVIEALAPTTPTYRVLRQALQELRAGSAGPRQGRDDPRARDRGESRTRTLAAAAAAGGPRLGQRGRRAAGAVPRRSAGLLHAGHCRPGRQPQSEPGVPGLDRRVLFNPPWNIPQDIATHEILPKASRDPNYLAKHNMVLLPDGGLQQEAGANSGLGQLMFYMNNRFDVYLHDTPSKNLFSRDDRRISHGCIRVEDPRKLAALLMQQPVDAIDQAIATGTTTWGALPKPVPVFVVYETAFADAEGKLQFRADIYGRDAEIWRSPGTKAAGPAPGG